MRGKAGDEGRGAGGVGIIPAGAGKRGRPWRRRPRWRDHPRGCGEKHQTPRRGGALQGSSPRVRGKARRRRRSCLGLGIIPAGAGKSRAFALATQHLWDHPRGCGEKFLCYSSRPNRRGSSPRVRGKGPRHQGRRPCHGIIPAGAGKSGGETLLLGDDGDHPRGCGEKVQRPPETAGEAGSSPRVRGKDLQIEAESRPVGIIPAGAGKSEARKSAPACPRDHPRGCGEKPASRPPPPACSGSSPRVRGKGRGRRARALRDGIIPAGAGKRRPPSPS